MKEDFLIGLQLEARCFKCQQVPSIQRALLEMENHLYICTTCYEDVKRKGENVSLVVGLQKLASDRPEPIDHSRSDNQKASDKLPPDSLFALLDLSLEATQSEVEEALNAKLKYWRSKDGDPRQKEMIAFCHDWGRRIQSPAKLEEERQRCKSALIMPLSVGGRSVWSIKEFLLACEDSREGWADGERYLRAGELQDWIRYQLKEPELEKLTNQYRLFGTRASFEKYPFSSKKKREVPG